MLERTVYSEDGLFLRALTVPNQANLDLNVNPGEIVVEGIYDDDTYYKNGAVLALPPRPASRVVFDPVAEQWVDARDAAQYEAELWQARQNTAIDIHVAMLRLAETGALGDPDLIVGEIANRADGFPAVVDEFLSILPANVRDYVLAGMRTRPIGRLDPRLTGPTHPGDPGDGLPSFIPWLASEKGITITPEQIDAAFGVEVEPLYVPA